MKARLTICFFSAIFALLGASTWTVLNPYGVPSNTLPEIAEASNEIETGFAVDSEPAESVTPNGLRFRLVASESRFFIDASSAGVLWFLGHNHHVAARDFAGEAELTAGVLEPASLRMTVKTSSLAETAAHFTDQQKQIITKHMQEGVLESAKYPEASLKSTSITAKKTGENQYDARIEGDLTLHGVTRHVMIPARVTIEGDTVRANGKFEFERDDYNIKTESVKRGTVRVSNDMKLSFDIVARRH